MLDILSMKKNAERDRTISNRVIDDFLIYYAAAKDRLDKKVDKGLKRYRHIVRQMPGNWDAMVKSQMIAHEIFKDGGRISAYLNHSDVKLRSKEELVYLRRQAERPWKFMFAELLDNPSPNMYRMQDVFTGEECLVYSRSMSKILASDQNIELWFFLGGYSGECIQTYGPIMHFRSFSPNDIAFFARLLDADLETGIDIANNIQQNPLPYTMLWVSGLAPSVYHKEYAIQYQHAEYYDDEFEAEPLYDSFKAEYTKGLYRFRLQDWSEFPHYATAYYHEKDSILYLTALTRTGFGHLVEALNKSGYDLSSEPHDAATPGMVSTASEVLRKEITMNSFDTFVEPETDSDDDDLEEVNYFLGLLMDSINNNKKPDIKKMAEQAGIDFETASELTEQVMERFGR
jgi:hypothetical protein